MKHFCSNKNHLVDDSQALISLSSGALICLNCIRAQSLKESDLSNLFSIKSLEDLFIKNLRITIKINPAVSEKLRKFLLNEDFRVLLGGLIDYLTNLGKKDIFITSISEFESKHKTKQVTLSLYDEKMKTRTFQTSYLKLMRNPQASLEKLTSQFLQLLNIPHVITFIIPWNKTHSLYISPEYSNFYELFDFQTRFKLENKTLLDLQNQFFEILAVWYYFGKLDFLHNQFYHAENENTVFLVQIDHENPGYPLAFSCSPQGLDYTLLRQELHNDLYFEEWKRILDFLQVGFDSDKGEKVNEQFIQQFTNKLSDIIEKVSKSANIKQIVLQKILSGTAHQWHDYLVSLFKQSPLIFQIFFPDVNLAEFCKETSLSLIKQLRGPWKSFVQKNSNSFLDNFPHQCIYEEKESFIETIEECLKKLNANRKDYEKLERLSNLLELSFQIWQQILLDGKIGLIFTEMSKLY
ncbi:MAG: hypothetical protein HeimC3_53670 [Candidatus Heimdallarchaeota archaeon LC_3]|nr:MAG: hypothetical protein HeimC3_53670 [Candidatus Heimdallarchaeota archaeon LC_3]